MPGESVVRDLKKIGAFIAFARPDPLAMRFDSRMRMNAIARPGDFIYMALFHRTAFDQLNWKTKCAPRKASVLRIIREGSLF
ncbi:hypothetical protein C7S16_1257 [Burkholderia thailandensis]|uniref:Uncharacterized protein n=1 Tax=Burkholderia thailandensis TaxID=57975 RepID=A0AAW9CVS1_BURTH|nr:hypothetical protein [Burkholderia thailandensis]MDW9254760.1 hypothetical protein [Burkholderia thailandensis]